MIIIEGMDNTGKTTLCKKLEQMIPTHKRFKLSEVSNPTRAQKLQVAADAKLPDFSRRALLMDRIPFVSEMVYGPIIREGSVYGMRGNWELWTNYINMHPTYVIYCRPPSKIVLSSMGEQMEGVNDKAKHLLARYDEVMTITRHFIIRSKHRGLFMEYDWTSPSDENSLKMFINQYITWEKDYVTSNF